MESEGSRQSMPLLSSYSSLSGLGSVRKNITRVTVNIPLSRPPLTATTLTTMFTTAVRAVRPVASAARLQTFKATRLPALRSLSTTSRASSEHGPPPPQLYGTGGKPGTVPSDLDQATGLERLQLLGDLEGAPAFDDKPLDASRIGTKADPIKVLSYVRSFSLSNSRTYCF